MASSINYFPLFCLALAFSLATSDIIITSDSSLDSDNNANGQCDTKPEGSRILLNEQAGVARICHGRGLSSVLQLQCDFNAGTFGLFLNGSAWVHQQEIALAPPPPFNKMSSLLTNKAVCPYPQNPSKKLRESYTYFNDAGGDAWSMKLPNTTMVIRQGRLYYETDVYLDQLIAAERCNTASQQAFTVHLSCCANPLTTNDVRVIPPSHEHCPVDACKLNPRFGCQCVKTENSILVHVETKDPTVSSTTGIDIVDLKLYPASYETAAAAGAEVVNITPNGPSTLDPTECAVPSSLPYDLTAVKEVAMDDFQFEGKPDEALKVECKVQYCTHRRSQDAAGRNLPACRSQPQLPRSATCPNPFGLVESVLE
ncbi:hypothetical protein RvY_12293 [Ramazzottius varieornatus]|uniref:ZP domain-containing protein n=1 Tax=Ramazzottius varieornatus TaxID=947166 RepID=A0A1D1VIZ2_RAMVA|nr:hypothetical protein RvY_12293 [Ramazzottius varieornatus]